MGGWKLEVFRMTGYVALPIVCFYLFNKPEYFKDALASTKQYYLVPEDQKGLERLNDFKLHREKDKEQKILAEIEALKNKSKNK